MPNILTTINQSCEPFGDFNDPLFVTSNGYKVFFREFIASAHNLHLVGTAIAWRNKEDRLYTCVAGDYETPFEYKRGDVWGENDYHLANSPTYNTPLISFKRLKEESVEKLRAFVDGLP